MNSYTYKLFTILYTQLMSVNFWPRAECFRTHFPLNLIPRDATVFMALVWLKISCGCRTYIRPGPPLTQVHAWPDLRQQSSVCMTIDQEGPHKLNSLFQRSAALASSACFTCAVHAGSCTGKTFRLISCALERLPRSYIYARFMESLWARAGERTRPILFMFVHDFPLLTLYQNEKMLTQRYAWIWEPVLNDWRIWCQSWILDIKDHGGNWTKITNWSFDNLFLIYEGVKKSSDLWHMPRNVGRPLFHLLP